MVYTMKPLLTAYICMYVGCMLKTNQVVVSGPPLVEARSFGRVLERAQLGSDSFAIWRTNAREGEQEA